MIHISIVFVFQKHVQTRRNHEFGCGDHNYHFFFFYHKTGKRVELTSQASSGTLHVPYVHHRVSVAFILRAPEWYIGII